MEKKQHTTTFSTKIKNLNGDCACGSALDLICACKFQFCELNHRTKLDSICF